MLVLQHCCKGKKKKKKKLTYIISQLAQTTSWPPLQVQTPALAQLYKPSSICISAACISTQQLLNSLTTDYTRYCQEVWKYSLTHPHGTASFHFDALPKRHFSHWYSDGYRTEGATITQRGVTKMIVAHKSCATFLFLSFFLYISQHFIILHLWYLSVLVSFESSGWLLSKWAQCNEYLRWLTGGCLWVIRVDLFSNAESSQCPLWSPEVMSSSSVETMAALRAIQVLGRLQGFFKISRFDPPACLTIPNLKRHNYSATCADGGGLTKEGDKDSGRSLWAPSIIICFTGKSTITTRLSRHVCDGILFEI